MGEGGREEWNEEGGRQKEVFIFFVLLVDDKTTLDYICNKTAAPYFSNLAWFIGNHVIELDECLISQAQ